MPKVTQSTTKYKISLHFLYLDFTNFDIIFILNLHSPQTLIRNNFYHAEIYRMVEIIVFYYQIAITMVAGTAI